MRLAFTLDDLPVSMSDSSLTQRELDIMSILWMMGEATTTEVRERLDDDLAYTSVSTMLRLLESKGFVSHRPGQGKTHVYYPIVDAETAGATFLARIIEKIYGGSRLNLLTHLVDQKRLSEKEIERMRQLLQRSSRKGIR